MREYRAPEHLSHSAVNTYFECPRRYYLEKGLKLSTKTWWANLAGTAFHNSIQSYDLREWGEDAPAITFEEAFEVEIEEAERKGLTVVASGMGKRTKKIGKTSGPNGKDKEWWLHWGPLYVQGYRDWRLGVEWELATLPNGQPGIEVPLDDVQVGGRPTKGFIDALFIEPSTGRLAIVDAKSGNKPKDEDQLRNYGTMLWRKWGLRADVGFYYYAPEGKPLREVKLHMGEYDGPLDETFEAAWEGIDEMRFYPNPNPMCGSCFVREWCSGVGGALAGDVPEPESPALAGVL